MGAWEVPFMFDAALREKLIRSNSLEEVEKLLSEHPDLDAKRVIKKSKSTALVAARNLT